MTTPPAAPAEKHPLRELGEACLVILAAMVSVAAFWGVTWAGWRAIRSLVN